MNHIAVNIVLLLRGAKLLANSFIIDVYRILGIKHQKLSVKEFPLYPDGRNALIEHPFYNVKNKSYFAQIYSSTNDFVHATAKRSYLNCVSEILPGQLIDRKFKTSLNAGDVIPIAIPSPVTEDATGTLTIETNQSSKKLQKLKRNSFYYIPIKTRSDILLSSNSKFIVGEPITKRHIRSKNKKLVVSLFVDGLASHVLENRLEEIMPNTAAYFSNGLSFHNTISTSNWTVPGCATLFSGLYPINHRMNDPNIILQLGDTYKTIGEYFQDLGYNTFQICSNFRKSPTYGYCLGFNRTLYRHSMNCKETIFHTIEHIKSFSDTDNYVWMTLFDLHHSLDGAPDTSLQTKFNIENFNFSEDTSKKSLFRGKDVNKTERYELEVNRIDFYLSFLYEYFSRNYSEDEIVISLCSDHGQRFLTTNPWPLSDEKVRVPMFFRGSNIGIGVDSNVYSTTDYLPTLLRASNSDTGFNWHSATDGEAINLMEKPKTKTDRMVISEAIFPRQTYKASLFSNKKSFNVESFQTLNDEDLSQDFIHKLDFKVTDNSQTKHSTSLLSEIDDDYIACIKAVSERNNN